MNEFYLIAACCHDGGIGKNNQIPWCLKEDMQHFKTITSTAPAGKQNAVVMGRHTWNSLPKKPLANRVNIVVSATYAGKTGVSCDGAATFVDTFQRSLSHIESIPNIHKVFVIGGSKMYEEALNHMSCKKAYVTHILKDYECDTFLPLNILDKYFILTVEGPVRTNGEKNICYAFSEYQRIET